MSVPSLAEATLLRYASAETFQHGRGCYQQGAVLAAVLYGTRLLAEVQTDGPVPAFVCSTFESDGSITATRTAVLGFDRSNKAKVLKSRIKFAVEK